MLEALLAPWTDAASRTFVWALLPFGVVVAAYWMLKRPAWRIRWHASHLLDAQLLLGRQLLGLLNRSAQNGLAMGIGVAVVGALDFLPRLTATAWTPVLYSVVLFVVWDVSRWFSHWLMHRVPALWAFHQVHHSAEVLTPLTFHRVHPVESAIYHLRGALSSGVVAGVFYALFRETLSPVTLLGVPAIGFVLNIVFGNLRHSHVWIPFPDSVERWFISPAQHQMHHALDGDRCNYGTWLAVWDRMAGTLEHAHTEPQVFGVRNRNHGNDLLSAWFGPLRGVFPLLLLLLSFPALAQEAEIPPDYEEASGTIVITDQDGTPRVAGSAHVLDEEDLETFEYNDIGQVVAHIPGMTVRAEDGQGLRPNLGIRGANSDRSAKITLMEDGILLAPAPYAAPAAYYFPMSTRMVAVEVFKGPAATRHGPQTVGGAVNLVTRPVPDGLGYGLDLAGGSYKTGKLHAHLGYGGQRAGVLAEGVHLRSAGFKTLDTGGPTGFDRSEFMLKAWFKPVPRHHLQLKLGYANETSHETYLGLSGDDFAVDPYRRYAASSLGLMAWKRSQFELAWTAHLSSHARIRTVAYHHYLDRSWTKLNHFGEGGPTLHSLLQSGGSGQSAVYLAILRGDEDSVGDSQSLWIGNNHRSFHSMGVQSVLRAERYGELATHDVEVGVRVHSDRVWRVHTEDAWVMSKGELSATGQDTVTTLDSFVSSSALAVHAHDEVQIGELSLLPGLRTEVVQTELTRVSLLPGAGVLYSLTPWVHAFAGAHRGFSPVAPGQPEEVKPELSWNYEAGLRLDEGARHAELVGFFNDYRNLTGQCTLSGGCEGDAIDTQFNGGEVHIWGLEAVLGTEFVPGGLTVPVTASYAWTQSRFQTSFVSGFPQFGTVQAGDFLPYVPQHQLAGRTGLHHDRFSLDVGLTWRSPMLDTAGTFGGESDIPALLLVDAGAQLHLHPKASLYATGTNLAGNDALASWRPFGTRPVAPRQVMVGLKVR